ncbi:hypothetical protein F441_02997 [Phytophthora nicotianae CJ01A1]|uniref:Uncharacterized protein n=2 Tax=Phytophthora nicotianae TaxID=4792 RepID=W2XM25_PHYNI|nr:hypothetical protein F441_02997 [Phytophthora nicotianae CJ01A1]
MLRFFQNIKKNWVTLFQLVKAEANAPEALMIHPDDYTYAFNHMILSRYYEDLTPHQLAEAPPV